ncbi:hypothetical protein AMELA_G00106030 [Ameiurus melas]|uniref:Uncharacterized protein n=1 Tax=Ameiurus melas TaxID=219545 RepID=A0A7J6AXY4_AMEME|nr:hypothetical protein AMELA_G00106030 [Ameiurus melas]
MLPEASRVPFQQLFFFVNPPVFPTDPSPAPCAVGLANECLAFRAPFSLLVYAGQSECSGRGLLEYGLGNINVSFVVAVFAATGIKGVCFSYHRLSPRNDDVTPCTEDVTSAEDAVPG